VVAAAAHGLVERLHHPAGVVPLQPAVDHQLDLRAPAAPLSRALG
jgi:hypothetical protein